MPTGSVIIPDSVTYNGIVYSVTNIGSSAFYHCCDMTYVSIPNTITRIEERAFTGCGLLSLVIPDSVNYIGNCGFVDCTSLTTLTIGTGIETLYWNSFERCSNIETLFFNATNCTYAGTSSWSAFRDCTSLSTIYVGKDVTNLPNYIFLGCNNLTNLILYATTPPTLGSNVFAGATIIANMVVKVPCGSIVAYQNSWGNSYNLQCLYTFTFAVTINTNDSTWGAGMYSIIGDSLVEITATPNYGYHFDHWSYGSTANPDTIMLTDDATITAIFAKNQYSVTGSTNDSTKGLVSGSATVDYLDTVTLTATANHGYQFVRWSDYSIENPRRIAATANITKTAIFDFNQYNLTVHADTSIRGYCNGSGSYNYLSERTISANANYGYHFTQWNDGNTDNPRVITLTQDTTFTALFAKNQYTLTVSSNDTTLGSVAGSGTYEYLDTIAISATAIEHYHFVRWDDGNTLNPRNIIMTSDISRTAIFAIDTHSVTLQAANITHGTCSGNGQYQYGTAATVEALPYSGYLFSHWSDGSTYNPYTFAVVNDIQLTAHFYAVGTPYQDTLYIDTLTIHDTVYFHDTTFVPVHDTTVVYITDSILIHDTVFVHDTIFVGVDEVDAINAKIYTSNGQIVVDGAERNTVYLYDVNGRILATKQDEYSPLRFNVPSSGAYMVKIGNHPARRVVVIR
ncbi:MAG: InlB B-repeat-containing protein [bacterium]